MRMKEKVRYLTTKSTATIIYHRWWVNEIWARSIDVMPVDMGREVMEEKPVPIPPSPL